jgi:NAD+ synthase
MNASSTSPLSWKVLELNELAEADRIAKALREITSTILRKRGLVVAISGGIDSSVSAALAVRALGSERVFGMLLPERDSSGKSSERGRLLAETLGIRYTVQDITAALEGVGCYAARDEAIQRTIPQYRPGWRSKIVLSGSLQGVINHFRVVVESPAGETFEARLGLAEYLQVVAATNHKQRIRKTIEYYHADRLNYAVIGTPNRLEYDQGFFVKNGDGSADVKPIAHLYKSQVYAMARALGLPDDICNATPTTDTYSLQQGQDEFYFGLPYRSMDLALWAYEHQVPSTELARVLELSPELAERTYRDIESKRKFASYLHEPPVLIDEYYAKATP